MVKKINNKRYENALPFENIKNVYKKRIFYDAKSRTHTKTDLVCQETILYVKYFVPTIF